MLLEKELAGLSPKSETVLTIGVFDGVHSGHKYLLSKLFEQSKNDKLISGVITFKQHPQRLLNPQFSPPFLTNLPQKIKLLRDEGVQIIIALTFTLELAQTGARQFIGLLQKYLKMRSLVLGPDFTLGRSQEGNVDLLRNLSGDMNEVKVEVLQDFTVHSPVYVLPRDHEGITVRVPLSMIEGTVTVKTPAGSDTATFTFPAELGKHIVR